MIDAVLPDNSRVWVFALEQKLSQEKSEALIAVLKEFCAHWKAHGAALDASVELIESQIVVLATSDCGAQASGCSIDQMTRVVNDECKKLGMKVVDPGAVLVQKEGSFMVFSRPIFKQLFAAGEITLGVRVVDTTIATLRDFRDGKLLPKLSESWHAKLVA